MDPPRWLRDTRLTAKVDTNFTKKLGGIIRSRTQATEFSFLV
jgi:hypothetical protein